MIRSMLSDILFVTGMLLLYDVFGLPRFRFPLTSPCITHFTSSHAPVVFDCVSKVGEFATYNKSSKLSGGIELCEDTFVCSVLSPTDS